MTNKIAFFKFGGAESMSRGSTRRQRCKRRPRKTNTRMNKNINKVRNGRVKLMRSKRRSKMRKRKRRRSNSLPSTTRQLSHRNRIPLRSRLCIRRNQPTRWKQCFKSSSKSHTRTPIPRSSFGRILTSWRSTWISTSSKRSVLSKRRIAEWRKN